MPEQIFQINKTNPDELNAHILDMSMRYSYHITIRWNELIYLPSIFSRHFKPKQFTVSVRYTFYQYVYS